MTMPAAGQLSEFVVWLLQSSLEACVLIGLLLAAQTVLRDRLSAGWRYASWLLLLAHLLIPWSPASQWSVYNLLPTEWNHPASSTPLAMSQDGWAGPMADQPTGFEPSALRAASHPADAPLPAGPSAIWLAVGCVWLAGAVALASLTLWRSVALARVVRRQPSVADAELGSLLDECKREIGYRGTMRVVETPGTGSPALFGILRPCVLLPSGMLRTTDRRCLRHVLLHELAHVKRRDVLLNLLATVLQIVHWFNPLIWYAFYRMRADRELACDALVLSRLGTEDSDEYGRTLVHLLERFCRRPEAACLTGFFEGKSQIRRRIEMITGFRNKAGSSPVFAVVMIVTLAIVTLTRAQDGVGTPTADTSAKADLIVPGERIGPVVLGIKANALPANLGTPKKAFYGDYTFALDNLPKKYNLCFDDLSVLVMHDHVEAITAQSPRWKLPSGLAVGSSVADVKKAMGPESIVKESDTNAFLVYEGLGLAFEIDKSKQAVVAIRVGPNMVKQQMPKESKLKFKAGKIVPGERVGPFSLGSRIDDFAGKLGEPKTAYYGGHTFALDNLPKKYNLCFGEVSLVVAHGSVQGISVYSPLWKLPDGLAVGASEQEVKKAMGPDFFLKESPQWDFMVYEKSGLRFTIDKSKRTVMEIYVGLKPQT